MLQISKHWSNHVAFALPQELRDLLALGPACMGIGTCDWLVVLAWPLIYIWFLHGIFGSCMSTALGFWLLHGPSFLHGLWLYIGPSLLVLGSWSLSLGPWLWVLGS